MANAVIWGTLGLVIGYLFDRNLRADNLRLNLTAGVGLFITAGFLLAPLLDVPPTTFTVGLVGFATGLALLSLLTPRQRTG